MTPRVRQALFETLYRHKHLYRFASTVPFAGQWREWQRQILPRLRGHEVLELGCGLGDLLADMLAAGYACRAIEHSPQMVAAARETLHKRQLGSPGLVLQGSAQHLPFAADAFDNVVSTFPSEYIYDPATIAEIERVLRPGGRLIVIEGASLLPTGFFQPILLLLQMLVYGPVTLSRSKRRPNNGKPACNVVPIDKDTGSSLTNEIVEQATFGRQIPLEQHNFRRKSELVRNRRWEVYVTLGEKMLS